MFWGAFAYDQSPYPWDSVRVCSYFFCGMVSTKVPKTRQSRIFEIGYRYKTRSTFGRVTRKKVHSSHAWEMGVIGKSMCSLKDTNVFRKKATAALAVELCCKLYPYLFWKRFCIISLSILVPNARAFLRFFTPLLCFMMLLRTIFHAEKYFPMG